LTKRKLYGIKPVVLYVRGLEGMESLSNFIIEKMPSEFLSIQDIFNSLDGTDIKITKYSDKIRFSRLFPESEEWGATLLIGFSGKQTTLYFEGYLDFLNSNKTLCKIKYVPRLNFTCEGLSPKESSDQSNEDVKIIDEIEKLVFAKYGVNDIFVDCPKEVVKLPDELALVFGEYEFVNYLEDISGKVEKLLGKNSKILDFPLNRTKPPFCV
jgi:hypothetical protein